MICLMPNCAFISETSRMIQIYKALKDRGVAARIATHGGMHETLLKDEGIDYDIIGPHMDEARSRRFLRDTVGIGDPGQSMYDPDEMRTYVLAEVEYFRCHEVQAVVIGFTLTTLLSTRIADVLLVTQHAGSYIPPLFERGMLPAPSRPVQPFFNYIPRSLARFLINKATNTPRLYLKAFDALCAELGIARIPSFPALLLGDLSLVTEAPEVYGVSEEEMRAWRPSGRAYWPTTRLEYTGPIFAEFDALIPIEVDEALGRKGPIVYVAITSAPAELVRSVVKEVAGTGAEVIVAATVHDLSDLAGPRVTVGGILPSQKIMPRVDLLVSAGGQGSLQCAMAAGTPVIGIPLQPEQDANVHLLELKGAARLLPEREIGRGRLAVLVREMTTQESYRTSARTIQAAYAGRNGPALSADAIARHVCNRMHQAG
ncbi:glycosyltransferase [Mesorhizobium sp. LHD-90]|uniref:glycosyltransferase n=1 Tax=Mesorhizobium sp. LHD-90 TaxID=3071414 RepID=UPI0027E1AC94|nr:nucleotide disphospho-sugar-binding domain-containing protein [Mesorhizobium sp. LHD-90]MDQ6436059.1 glycosyltransferase [Mesorhizobium sp. LHD-90]